MLVGTVVPLRRKALRGVVASFGLTALLLANPLARAVSRPYTYVHPSVEFGPGWTAELVAVNSASHTAIARLAVVAGDGTQVATVVASIAPGERRVFSKADGSWPAEAAWVRIESDTPLLTYVSLWSVDGTAWETAIA